MNGGAAITGTTQWDDLNVPRGRHTYMVRTARLEGSDTADRMASGTYTNLSQGIRASVDAFSAVAWDLTILAPESGVEHTWAYAVNDNSTYDTVGAYADYPVSRARRWVGAATYSLSSGYWSSSDQSWGFGVNKNSETVGSFDKWDYYQGYGHTIRAYRWPSGSAASLLEWLGYDPANPNATPRDCEALAINDNGVIVGEGENENGAWRAMRWDPNNADRAYKWVDLRTFYGTETFRYSSAYALNNAGYFGGRAQKDISGTARYRAYLCAPHLTIGDALDIGVLSGGSNSEAYGLNDRQEVVGGSQDGGTAYKAFIRRLSDTAPVALPLLSGGSSSTASAATAINNASVVVGKFGNDATIWREGMANVRKLTDLVSFSSSGVTPMAAEAINEDMVIVGWGTDQYGNYRGFIIAP